jgi:hypothetical protein
MKRPVFLACGFSWLCVCLFCLKVDLKNPTVTPSTSLPHVLVDNRNLFSERVKSYAFVFIRVGVYF